MCYVLFCALLCCHDFGRLQLQQLLSCTNCPSSASHSLYLHMESVGGSGGGGGGGGVQRGVSRVSLTLLCRPVGTRAVRCLALSAGPLWRSLPPPQ